jgi:hypothetical protein
VGAGEGSRSEGLGDAVAVGVGVGVGVGLGEVPGAEDAALGDGERLDGGLAAGGAFERSATQTMAPTTSTAARIATPSRRFLAERGLMLQRGSEKYPAGRAERPRYVENVPHPREN